MRVHMGVCRRGVGRSGGEVFFFNLYNMLSGQGIITGGEAARGSMRRSGEGNSSEGRGCPKSKGTARSSGTGRKRKSPARPRRKSWAAPGPVSTNGPSRSGSRRTFRRRPQNKKAPPGEDLQKIFSGSCNIPVRRIVYGAEGRRTGGREALKPARTGVPILCIR